jgi:Lrp/AsnC family transcriptional regulator, leucine-responsive regulatory protein
MNELDDIDLHILRVWQHNTTLTNQALAQAVHVSPPTCLRRLKRLRDAGYIECEVAILNSDKLAGHSPVLGYGLTALVEITLDIQHAEALTAFETRACQQTAVQQCYRTSPGPDFMLVVCVADMAAYLALSHSLFSSDTNVRNTKAFFSIKRAKFGCAIPL